VNICVVSTFKRPFHTRLCLEAIARAHRWHKWADVIAVCRPSNGHEHPEVWKEICAAVDKNGDVPFEVWSERCDSNPHAASKWMLDQAFSEGAEMALYVEDDAILAPDAFLMCEYAKRHSQWMNEHMEEHGEQVLGCCLYHETIPAQYKAEGREPDPTLLHLSNGLNTCGGTAFLREPYLKFLSPNWNSKQVEPKGFDYSAHYQMYLSGLFMLWPDFSRSMNIGFELGSISQPMWAQYFGKSLVVDSRNALRHIDGFRFDGLYPHRVLESWMNAELQSRSVTA